MDKIQVNLGKEFPMRVTAELRAWYLEPSLDICWGNCHGDIKGRFRDGALIHTSTIKELRDMGNHFLCITLNSVYLLHKDRKLKTSSEYVPGYHPSGVPKITHQRAS
jgi:hypothetical protein